METGELKKWHIGLGLPLFTGLLVFAYLMIEPTANPRTTSVMMFEYAATGKPVGKDNPQPRVQDIRVYPPVNGLYIVNFKQLVEDVKNDRWLLQDWSFTARTPGPRFPNKTIPEWLGDLQRDFPDRVKFTYEWWREPKRLWSIWGVFSGLVFAWGCVLPTVMWFAKGGAKEFKENAMAAEPQLAAAKAGPTAADHDRLDEMLDRLEEQTGGVGAGVPAESPAKGKPNPAAAPAVLTGKPLETVAALDQPKEEKEYKVDIYPVVRPGKK